MNLDQWFRRYNLNIFLFLALVAILFSRVEWFVNFGRGHYEEHFCEIILNLDQWLDVLQLWWPVWQSRTICAILVVGIRRNNSVKSF